ncbi:hypothetical protein [Parasphingorhabdus sp.]
MTANTRVRRTRPFERGRRTAAKSRIAGIGGERINLGGHAES